MSSLQSGKFAFPQHNQHRPRQLVGSLVDKAFEQALKELFWKELFWEEGELFTHVMILSCQHDQLDCLVKINAQSVKVKIGEVTINFDYNIVIRRG